MKDEKTAIEGAQEEPRTDQAAGTALVATDHAAHANEETAETAETAEDKPEALPEGHGQTNAPAMTHPADLSHPVPAAAPAAVALASPMQGSPISGMNMDPIAYHVVANQERSVANPTAVPAPITTTVPNQGL